MLQPILAQVGTPGFADIFNPADWANLFTNGRLTQFVIGILIRLACIILIVLATRLLVGLIRKAIQKGVASATARSGKSQRRLSTLQGLLISALSYLIYFVAIVLILFVMGVTWKGLAPLLGAASVLGLAVGFGAQKLVRDVITGLFILGEGQFDAGDWVTIGGVTGQVEDMGLRVTRLRDDQGRAYTIANGDITQVFNASRGAVRYPIEVSLDRSTPLDEGIESIGKSVDAVLAEYGITPGRGEQPAIMVVGMEATKVTVRIVLWVPFEQRSTIEDTLRRRVLAMIASKEATLALA